MEYFIQLDIIKLKSNKLFEIRDYILISSIILLFICIYENANNYILTPIALITLTFFLLNQFKNYFYKDFVKVGKITFFKDMIVVNIDNIKNAISLDDPTKIDLFYKEYRGELVGNRSFEIKSGSNNKIKIFDGINTYEYNLFFDFNCVKRFNNLLLFWKNSNINYYINHNKQAKYLQEI